MGVHGLIPFLRKSCPGAIKPLKRRFQEISGARVVIDGTLITQRFHFAPSPHPYRHVLGWYKLFEELSASRVSATCIFDGKDRHAAKAREVLRRRASHAQVTGRGHVENQRVTRLQFFNKLLIDLPSIPQHKTTDLAEALESLRRDDPQLDEVFQELKTQASPNALEQLGLQAHAPAVAQELVPAGKASLETLIKSLRAVFEDFKANAKLLNSRRLLEYEDTSVKHPTDDVDGSHELVLSKAQNQLLVMERDLWSQLSSLSPSDLRAGKAGAQLQHLSSQATSLLDQSWKMSTSFNRRSQLPTTATYQECREILRAMGVTCIDSPGATEGEALASSIVLSGDGDFVMSEDTDVLVYGAPLLRNVTNTSEPLETISAQQVQRSLDLDPRSYLDFNLLLGTDFTQRIKNVGPHRALQFIKAHGSIENVLKYEPQYLPRIPIDEYLKEVNTARALFTSLPAKPGPESIVMSTHDDVAITDVLTRYKLRGYLPNSSHWAPDAAFGEYVFHDNPVAL